jgi:hypothetical protein
MILSWIRKLAGSRQDTPPAPLKRNTTPDPQKSAFSERALLLVELWQAGRIREIRESSQGGDFLHPVVLELHAKSAYLVLKQEGRQAAPDTVHHFIDCWLSFLFHPSLFYSLPNKPENSKDSEQYRLELFSTGETIVRKYAEQQLEHGVLFVRHWEEDYDVLLTLREVHNKVHKDADNLALYTPALAWKTGIADKIFSLMQEWKEIWPDQERSEEYEKYFAAGSWYSPIGPALLLARNLAEQGEAASDGFTFLKKDFLDKKSKEKKTDLFFLYGLARLGLDSGLHALEQGNYQEAANILIDLFPLPPYAFVLERELLAVFAQDDKYLVPEWLEVSVAVLSELHKHSPGKAVKKAFCSVLTHQAVLLHNTRSIDEKALLRSMEKAVSLNPDDPFARMTLDDARMDAEIFSLHQTMTAGKLAKASKIAQKSSYPEVTEQFFIFVAQVIEQVEAGDYPDDEAAFFMVCQLLEGALEVDSEHAMIEKISLLADELEERLESL